jgi:hypothetical protein
MWLSQRSAHVLVLVLVLDEYVGQPLTEPHPTYKTKTARKPARLRAYTKIIALLQRLYLRSAQE